MFTEEELAEFEKMFGTDEYNSLFGDDDTYTSYVSYESSDDGSAGAVTGFVFMFLVCGGIGYCCYRKKKRE